MTDDSHAQLRLLVDEALLAGTDDCVSGLIKSVYGRARSSNVPFDGAAVLEYWSHLIRTGIVAVPGDSLGATPFQMPNLLLTQRGRHFLNHGEKSPHNPSKYLAAVRRRVSKPDDVALCYLSEAVEAWRCGLNRSSAVMLGCACERLVLLLAEAIAANQELPGADKIRKEISGRVFVSPLFEDIRSTLTRLRGEKKLPRELGEALDRKLSAIFDHARGLRNESGHPSGENVSGDDAEAGLLLFPGFSELVDGLIAALSEA